MRRADQMRGLLANENNSFQASNRCHLLSRIYPPFTPSLPSLRPAALLRPLPLSAPRHRPSPARVLVWSFPCAPNAAGLPLFFLPTAICLSVCPSISVSNAYEPNPLCVLRFILHLVSVPSRHTCFGGGALSCDRVTMMIPPGPSRLAVRRLQGEPVAASQRVVRHGGRSAPTRGRGG